MKPAYIDQAHAASNPTVNPNNPNQPITPRRGGRFGGLRKAPTDAAGGDEIEEYIDEVERIERARKQKERNKNRPGRDQRVFFTPERPGYFNEFDFEDPYLEDWLSEDDLPFFPGENWDRSLRDKEIRFAPDDWDVYSENRFQKGWDADSIPKHKHFIDYERGDVKLRVYGKANVIATYGDAYYLSDKDEDDPNRDANARKVSENFVLNMGHTLHIRGIIGRKVTVKADIESGRAVDDWEIKYTGDQREFIDYVRVGNFPLKFGQTEFLVWEKTTRRTVGAEAKASRGKIRFHAVATLTKGEQGTSTFRGQTQEAKEVIRDFRYIRRRYYQIEPFCAFDNLCSSSPPTISAASYDPTSGLTTLTSSPVANWLKTPDVGINGSSIEVFIQDNKPGEPTYSIASLGNFRRMRTDEFTFNGTSGVLEFNQAVRYDRMVLVRYLRTGSNSLATSDPSATVADDPTGTGGGQKIQVVIKGRTGIEEDTDHDGDSDVVKVSDGQINRDVYELKGYYNLNESGTGEIKQDNFNLTFRNNNNEIIEIPAGDPFGVYEVNFETGIVFFQLREPFRAIKNSSGSFIFEFVSPSDRTADKIYNENLNPDTADFTRVALHASFFRQVRAYRLQPNIVPGSVRVIIDGKQLRSSKFFVENFEGTLVFLDENDPYIGPESTIVVHYEYNPFGAAGQQGYVAGLRTEYQASRDILVGNTIMFNGQFAPSEAPRVGEAPTSKVVLEGDVAVDFNEERVTRFANKLPLADFDLLPMRVQGYAEYARTYFNPNTFGVALIDDMEGSEDETVISVDASVWQLASPPSYPTNLNQTDRAFLYYRYYYDPDSPERGLLGTGSNVEKRSKHNPPYSGSQNKGAVPGPYNVAEGHLNISQVNTEEGLRQESMALEFDFSKTTGAGTGDRFISIGQGISRIGKNFSTVSYIEFNARLLSPLKSGAPEPTSGVRLHFDVGIINEDADGDASSAIISSLYPGLDTEDQGYVDGLQNESTANVVTELNNALDKERDNIKKREDRGFVFNFPDGTFTRVGAGPGVTNLLTAGASLSDDFPSTIGNGQLNSEDWNFDNLLDTTEQIFTFDDTNVANGKLRGVFASNFLLQKSGWQQYRFYINRQLLDETEKAALDRVFAIRVWVTPAGNNNMQAGRILIDGIRFAGSKWRQVKGRNDLTLFDTFDLDDPNVVRITNIDTFNSKDEYLEDSFIEEQREQYEEIHGQKTNTEIKQVQESALKFEYDGNIQPSLREVMATRQFVTSMDLSYYRRIALWVNFREGFNRGDRMIIRVGSSDNDYFEYSQKIDIPNWQKLIYDLRSKGADTVIGDPNLRNINRMEIGVRNESLPPQGEIWVNDILVQNPSILQDDAYIYRTSVAFTKPAFKTAAGVPILGDFKIDFEERNKGANFSTIGQQASGIEEFRQQLNIGTAAYGRYWGLQYSFLHEETEADPDLVDLLASRNGSTWLEEHGTVHNLAYVDYTWLPTFTLGYKNRRFRAERTEEVDEPLTNTKLDRDIKENEEANSPTLQIKEVFPEFWATNVSADYSLAVRYFKKITDSNTEGNVFVAEENDYLVSRQQSEGQKGAVNMKAGHVVFSPTVEWEHERLLSQNQGDQIVRKPLSADFYAPIVETPKDFRYRTRGHKAGAKLAYTDWIINPSLDGSTQYLENNFTDNILLAENARRLGRQKSATTTVQHGLSIPTKVFVEKPALGFFQSFTPTYKREVTLIEQKVPFTARTNAFDEPYGLNRTGPPMMDSVFNLGRFPYWHYPLNNGERTVKSMSNGRDFVNSQKMKLNSPNDALASRFIGYDNSLTYRESATATMVFAFWNPLQTTFNAGHEQTAIRPTIQSLPSQEGRYTFGMDNTLDLMKVLSFWFWRPNEPGKSIHRSQFNLRNGWTRQQVITQNVFRDIITTEPSITFSWGYHSLIFTFGFDVNTLREFEYIKEKSQSKLDRRLWRQIPPVPKSGIDEFEYTWRPGIKYLTQIPELRIFFERQLGIKLLSNPKYTVALEVDINRYDFDIVQRLPTTARDLWTLRNSLDLNLHANLTGGLDMLLVYDVARNPVSDIAKTEIFGWEIGVGLKILF